MKKSEREPVKKQLYFRQTGPLDKESDCINWFEHHSKLGTPVAVILINGRYAVWVVGEEAVGSNTQAEHGANEEVIPDSAILLNEANGFAGLVGI